MKAVLALVHQPPTRRIFKILFVGLAVIGLIAALMPTAGVGVTHADKALHAAALFCFALLLDLASLRRFWQWKVPVLLAYGALIEVAQSFTPWRFFSGADFVADAAGILLYWLVWKHFLQDMIPHPNG